MYFCSFIQSDILIDLNVNDFLRLHREMKDGNGTPNLPVLIHKLEEKYNFVHATWKHTYIFKIL